MKGKGWVTILAISNIILAAGFAYEFYAERRATGTLQSIKKLNANIQVDSKYSKFWLSVQASK